MRSLPPMRPRCSGDEPGSDGAVCHQRGIDHCADAFVGTVLEAVAAGLGNLAFREADVSRMAGLREIELVLAFEAIHDQPDLQRMLRFVAASLKDGGVLLAQGMGGSGRLEEDRRNPFAPMLYMMSVMHCTPISLEQGGLELGTIRGEQAQALLDKRALGAWRPTGSPRTR